LKGAAKMLTITKEIEKARALQRYIKNNYPELQILEIQSEDAVGEGAHMLLFGNVSEWARIITTDSSALPLEAWLKRFGATESFSERLNRYMAAKALTGPALYNKAHISRSVFSDVQSGKAPSKKTAVKICMALELTLKQAMELLQLAGYTLSRNRKEDLIIMYCILKKEYGLIKVNHILHENNCQLLMP
jgi:hypothetical protein